VRELFPGVHHWTAVHPAVGLRVSSYYVEPAGVVIDPILPEDGLDAFAGRDRPQQIVLTSGLHTRDADRFADAFGCPIMTSREGAERIGGALDVETYGDGDDVAPGVRAVHVGVLCPDEYALHITATEGALALADGLHHYGESVGFFGDDLLGDDPQAVKDGLKQQFVALLQRDFDHLLFAHGDPVVGNGKTVLREFATSPVGALSPRRPPRA
jgi:hypothetical protein